MLSVVGSSVQQINKEQGMIKSHRTGSSIKFIYKQEIRPMEIGSSLFLVDLLNGRPRTMNFMIPTFVR
jgi:hypothetical protein